MMLKRFSTREMASFSDTIVSGKVVDIKYATNDKKQTYTFIEIECDNVLKGKQETKRFKVVQQGGKTEHYTTAVYGAPSYAVNEEVVLFLGTSPKEETVKYVVALSQGKYSVIEDKSTGKKYAVNDLSEIHFLDPKDQNPADKSVQIPLEQFIDDIKQAVQMEDQNTKTSGTGIMNQPSDGVDWILWIRKKIVVYLNKMGYNYRNYISGNES
jgi:hypothetical protein